MPKIRNQIQGEQIPLIPLDPPPRTAKQRRHSPKGKASGSIKPRLGNTKRRNPTTSYYYEWTKAGKKRSAYIPVRRLATITEMIEQRCSVDEILQLLTKETT